MSHSAMDLDRKMAEKGNYPERPCEQKEAPAASTARSRKETRDAWWDVVRMTRANDQRKRLEKHQDRQECGFSALPSKLLLKIFLNLSFDEWLTCAEVCCSWQSVVQSGSLWSQIDFSMCREQLTDATAKTVLQNYALFVIHLNLRGCTRLTMDSFNLISYCRNLQELNMSECVHATDFMIRKIIVGCPWLLYLNISGTNVTNKTIHELSRTCLNLLYLSLAYCCTFTDGAFLYLNTEKGFHNLIHLNLSGCTQMTVYGFEYISARCPSLKEIFIDDMPTLSDSCIKALANRHGLAAISILGASHLSDAGVVAVAKVSKLKRFSIQGNYQISDVSWKTLCVTSPELCRLHAAECPRMTDASLKFMAALKNLQYLDVSYCPNLSDDGISYLTDGSSASKLNELNMSHCSLITDECVRRIAHRLVKLQHLNLSYCDMLTDEALAGLSGSFSLRSLDVSGCNVHDQGLAALERIPMKTLILADCINITDIGIEVLCQRVRHLEQVDVSRCTSLSDASVRALSLYCPGLLKLRVSGCLKLTDVAVQHLSSGAQYLRALDVSGCVLLTNRTARHLLKMCPPLSSVTMTCCSGISGFSASQLKPHVQLWQHSSDDPTTYI